MHLAFQEGSLLMDFIIHLFFCVYGGRDFTCSTQFLFTCK